MIAKTKIIGRQWGFLSGGRIKSQKRWNCADRSYFMLRTRNNCCSKWVPTPFSCQTKKYSTQQKPKYRFLWENGKMGGIWHYWCSTTNKNDQLFQHKWEHNRKNKRKIWKQNKKCLHKCTYCLLLAGNLKCSCYLLLAGKKCNLRWIQNNSWYQWGTVVLVLRGGNCWFWLFIVTQENFILVKCLKKVEA